MISRFYNSSIFHYQNNIGIGSETNGKWKVIPLDEALIRIDEIWDGVFDHNQLVTN
jgi:hypothetical protein